MACGGTTGFSSLEFIHELDDFPNLKAKFFNDLDDAQKARFVEDFKGADNLTIKKLNDEELVEWWKKIDETEDGIDGLDLTVKASARESVEYLEIYKNTFNSTKANGDRLDDHLFVGHPTIHPNNGRVRGVGGVHSNKAITETDEIVLQSTKVNQQGAPIYNLPEPTSGVTYPIAIEEGTRIDYLNGVYSVKVWIFGDEMENGVTPVKGWRKKSGNQGESTMFPDIWSKEKTIMEIAYARWKLTKDKWFLEDGQDTSNLWRGESSDGKIEIGMYIGPKLEIPPTAKPSTSEEYGSAFPIKN